MANKISRVVGIDLGTTNSVIAMMGPDNKEIIVNTDKNNRRTFPSVLAYDKRKGGLVAGFPAFNKRGSSPEPIVSIKRNMADVNFRAKLGDRELTPTEVSAEYLRNMKEQFQEYLANQPNCGNYIVDRAVVTVPAYFGSAAREATGRAGELAGFKVEKTLEEPSAASTYFAWINGVEDGIFLVYDLGGGTFDISIVRYESGFADVVAIEGNNYLGGDTFDDALARRLLEHLKDEDFALDLQMEDPDDARRFTKLKLAAEIIKKHLSSEDEYDCAIDGIFLDQDGAAVNLSIVVTRSSFEELILPHLENSIELCKKALASAEEKAGITLDMIDGILLVGGSSHIPLVWEIVRKNFCDPGLEHHTKSPEPFHENPDMAVGFGAAIAAMTCDEISISESETGAVLEAQVGSPNVIRGKSTITGKIIATRGELPGGLKAHVTKNDGSHSNEFPIAQDGSFKFTALPAAGSDEKYTCVVNSASSQIMTFSFNAGSDLPPAPPSTLSHTLYIKLQDQNTGTEYMKPLMEKGINLPAAGDYRFKTQDRYAACVNIYEDNMPLCDIQLDFEDGIPEGSPVDVSLEIDDKSTKYVTASGGGKFYKATLEAPPPKEIFESDVRESFADFESRLSVAPTPKQVLGKAKLNNQFRALKEEIEQAIALKEQTHAHEKLNELREEMDKFIGKELSPTTDKFEEAVRECRRLNREKHDGEKGIEDQIANFQKRASECYSQGYTDTTQAALTDVFDKLNQLKKELADEGAGPQETPPPWIMTRLMCQFIQENMRKADENQALRQSARLWQEAQSKRIPDSRMVASVIEKVSPFTSEDEATAMQIELRPIFRRWSEYAEYKSGGLGE